MDKLTLYFFLFVAFCGKDVLCRRRVHNLKGDGGKIVGGNETTIQTYPYQAYLLLYDGRDYYQCGGTIVNRFNIVTAAHCLAGIQTIYVRIASTDSNSGGLQYQTNMFNSHPLYNANTSDFDAGTIRVIEGMTLDGTNARAIRMARSGSDVADGEDITFTGWGATSENGPTSTILQTVTIPAVNRTRCNELNGGGVTTRMVCAGLPEGGKDTCQGDSGGPGVTGGNLVAIVSYGFGCARPNLPGVSTRVGHPGVRQFLRLMTGS